MATIEVTFAAPLLTFEKQVLSDRFFSEGACFADINSDGHQDIISGPYYYKGPDFESRVAFEKPLAFRIKQYSKFFFCFSHDFNGDNRPDILGIPMPGAVAHWYENPGTESGPWKKYPAFDDVGNESPDLTDITGDGKPELVCCHGGVLGYAEPNWDNPTAAWKFTAISGPRGYHRFTHGLGVGDVNGDGKTDVLETSGWWEQRSPTKWKLHETKFAQAGGAQMFAYDVDGDGDNDVISSQNAHAWGLCWFEHVKEGGKIAFKRRTIMTNNAADNPYGVSFSQLHAMALHDMNGDGIKDIITGKRFYAHGGGDPGAHELPVLYWFETRRSSEGVAFEPWLVDRLSGVGDAAHGGGRFGR